MARAGWRSPVVGAKVARKASRVKSPRSGRSRGAPGVRGGSSQAMQWRSASSTSNRGLKLLMLVALALPVAACGSLPNPFAKNDAVAPDEPPEKLYKNKTTFNDVWASADGVTWKCIVPHAPWL